MFTNVTIRQDSQQVHHLTSRTILRASSNKRPTKVYHRPPLPQHQSPGNNNANNVNFNRNVRAHHHGGLHLVSRHNKQLQQTRRPRHRHRNPFKNRVHRLSNSKLRSTSLNRQTRHHRAPLKVVRVNITKGMNSPTVPRQQRVFRRNTRNTQVVSKRKKGMVVQVKSTHRRHTSPRLPRRHKPQVVNPRISRGRTVRTLTQHPTPVSTRLLIRQST